MVAHLTATPYFLVAFGGVDRDLVVGRRGFDAERS
jgi:hypothetical protein